MIVMTFARFRFLPILSLLIPFAACAQDDPLPVHNDTAVHAPSKIMGETRTLWVHLPADYYTSKNTYPVLYLLDGDWHFKYAPQAVEYLAGYDCNRMPDMIVVGIVNIDRGRDLTPVYAKKANGSNDSTSVLTTAGAGKFLRYIEGEVVPYIDAHYRVQPYRVLFAHSLAGLFALYAKETRPQLFPAMIMASPVTSDAMLKNLQSFLGADHPNNGKMFVGIGDENTVKVDALMAGLKRQSPAWFGSDSRQYHGENHFTAPYRSLFDGLKFIYRDWFFDYYGNQPVSLEDINTRFAKLSAGSGYAISPNEDYLNNCGYYDMRLKQVDKAIPIFIENVKRYPASFNVYDSLGEAYMKAGNRELAIKNYKKSLELNPHNEGGRQALEKLGVKD